MTEDEAERADLLKLINSTPALQSLLYDLDMMPEQLKEGEPKWELMLAYAVAYQAAAREEWQPIASAPKDRHIIAMVAGKERIVRWGKTSHVPMYGFCLADQGAEDFDICHPTVWKHRPKTSSGE